MIYYLLKLLNIFAMQRCKLNNSLSTRLNLQMTLLVLNECSRFTMPNSNQHETLSMLHISCTLFLTNRLVNILFDSHVPHICDRALIITSLKRPVLLVTISSDMFLMLPPDVPLQAISRNLGSHARSMSFTLLLPCMFSTT